jgi:hypothetical protein
MWSYTFHMPTRFKVFLLESTMGCTGGRNIQPEQLTGLTFHPLCTSLQVLMEVFRHDRFDDYDSSYNQQETR